MNLCLIAQLRNEIDIVEPFLRHADALFDRVYLIDHQSVDGTGEVLKQAVSQRPSWSYFFLDSKTKLQTATSNLMIHEAFKHDIDFLFFLDADEFIEVESRQALEHRLTAWSDHSTVCALKWKNCICQEYSNELFSFQTRLWIPPVESLYEKVIVPKEIYHGMGGNITITTGNHAACSPSREQVPATKIGTLLHVPIRSRDQAIKKVIVTVISHRGYKERIPGYAFQHYEMLEKIAHGWLTEDDLRGFTIGYEKSKIENSAVSNSELEQRGYSLVTFEIQKIATRGDLILSTPQINMGFVQIIANALDHLESNIPDNVKLTLENGILRIAEPAIS